MDGKSSWAICCCLQVLVYGDCAVNTDPNPEQLAKIGITSAETAAAFGIEPRVAFLSYSTFGSGAGPDVEKASFNCNANHSRPTGLYTAQAVLLLPHMPLQTFPFGL